MRAPTIAALALCSILRSHVAVGSACNDPNPSPKPSNNARRGHHKLANRQTTCALADSVYTHASIYTVDGQDTVYKDGAVAVKSGRISWIGQTSELLDHVDVSGATIISVNGKPMYPGFIDSHLHVFRGGLTLTACNLDFKVYNLDGLLSKIQACLDAETDAASNAWFFATSFDRAGFSQTQGSDLTYQMLAALQTTRPIVVQTMDQHSLVLNAAGLQATNITCSTPDVVGGRIVRDAKGCPTGALEDGAELLVVAAIPNDNEQDKRWLMAANKMLNSYGITSYMDAASEVRMAVPFQEVMQAGQLTARANFCFLTTPEVTQLYPGQVDETLAKFQAVSQAYDSGATVPAPGMNFRAIKMLSDGVYEPPSKTASLIAPYYTPDSTGKLVPDAAPVPPYYNATAIRSVFESAKRHGFRLQVHADGDGAVRDVLDAMEGLGYTINQEDFGMAHFEIVQPEDIARIGELNLTTIPSPQWAALSPVWKSIDGAYDTYQAVGPERIALAEPFGLVAQEHAKRGQRGNAYGSDWPVDVYDPFLQYFAAVLRRGDPLNPHSAAYSNPTAYGGQLNTMPGESRVAALRAMTMNSAHWLGMDKDIGSLEMGKMADFVILQRDMIDASTPDALIGNNTALLTVVGGQVVHQSDLAVTAFTSGQRAKSRRAPIDTLLAGLTSEAALKRDAVVARGSYNPHLRNGRSLKKRVIGEHSCGCAH